MIYKISHVHNTTMTPSELLLTAANVHDAAIYARYFCSTTTNSSVTHVELVERPTHQQRRNAVQYPPNFNKEWQESIGELAKEYLLKQLKEGES